ncbi:serine/threonine-protein kinase PAK 3-like [Agelaius tricolor]|uniref:serine/threonine-protein kinase PAK 3-like n=1 Tax=Agelaius tricolor TaxID=9191 RepID=UPI0039F17412
MASIADCGHNARSATAAAAPAARGLRGALRSGPRAPSAAPARAGLGGDERGRAGAAGTARAGRLRGWPRSARQGQLPTPSFSACRHPSALALRYNPQPARQGRENSRFSRRLRELLRGRSSPGQREQLLLRQPGSLSPDTQVTAHLCIQGQLHSAALGLALSTVLLRILVLKEFSADGLHPERSLGFALAGIQCANPHSAAKMIGQVCAAVCTVFSVVYSGYYLTQLTRHLTRGWRQAWPLASTAGSAAPLAASGIEEEAEEEQKSIKPPAALPAQPELAEPLNTGSAIQPGAAGPAWPAAASSPPAAGTSCSSAAQQPEMRQEQGRKTLSLEMTWLGVRLGDFQRPLVFMLHLSVPLDRLPRTAEGSRPDVAIKIMSLEEEMSEELAANEILAMRDNRSPNIVTYLDSYLVDAELWLAMEFMDGGTLFDVLSAVYPEEGQIGAVCREVFELIERNGPPKLQNPRHHSALLCDFLRCCLQADEDRRWSAQELLQHPFVTSGDPASSLAALITSAKQVQEDWRGDTCA